MEAEFNYKYLFDQAVQRIRGVRDPHSTRPETTDLKWDEVRKQVLFDFGGTEYEKYSNVLDAAQKTSISILSFIIAIALSIDFLSSGHSKISSS